MHESCNVQSNCSCRHLFASSLIDYVSNHLHEEPAFLNIVDIESLYFCSRFCPASFYGFLHKCQHDYVLKVGGLSIKSSRGA